MVTPNSVAKKNGNWGEDIAIHFLQAKFGDVTYVNDLIDFYTDSGIPIEVKTCQEFINRVDNKGDLRHGRFTMMKDQHELLLAQGGYYLFIVKAGVFILKARLIKACDVFMSMLNFRPQITWVGLV